MPREVTSERAVLAVPSGSRFASVLPTHRVGRPSLLVHGGADIVFPRSKDAPRSVREGPAR